MKRYIILIILFFTSILYTESHDIISRLQSISKGNFPPEYIEYIRNSFINNPGNYNTISLITFLKDRELKENADILALQMVLAILSDNISEERITGIYNDLNRKDLINILGKDYDSLNNAVYDLYIQIEYRYYTNRYYRFHKASHKYMKNRLSGLQTTAVPNPFDNSPFLISDIDENRVNKMREKKRIEAGKIEAYTHRMLYDFSFYWEGLYSLFISYHTLNQIINRFVDISCIIDAFFEDTLDEAYLFNPDEYITGGIEKKALSFEAMLQKRIDDHINDIYKVLSEIDDKSKDFNNKVRLYNERNNRNFAQARIISSPDPEHFDLNFLYDTYIKIKDSIFDHACFNDILQNYKSLSKHAQDIRPDITSDIPDMNIFSGLPLVSDLPVLEYIINECKSAGVPPPPFQRTRTSNIYSKGTIQRMVFDYFNHEIENYRNWIKNIDDIYTFDISMRNTLDHLFVHPSVYNRNIEASSDNVEYAYRNLFRPEPAIIKTQGYYLPDNILRHIANSETDPKRFLYYLKRTNDSLSFTFSEYIKNTVSNYIKSHLSNKDHISLLSERLYLLSHSFYAGSLKEPIYFIDNTFFYSNNKKVFKKDIKFQEIDRDLYIYNDQIIIEKNDIYLKDSKAMSIYDYLNDFSIK